MMAVEVSRPIRFPQIRNRLRRPTVNIILLIAAPFITFCLLFGYPVARLFLLSVDAPHFTLRHYISFFGADGYLPVLIRTVTISGIVTLCCLLLGYPIAYLLSSVRARVRALLLCLVFLPYLTSFLVRSYAWIVLLDDRGVVNSILRWLGLINQPLELIYNSTSVYIGMVQILLPYMILPLFAVMSAIDRRTVLAGQSMGAGSLRSFLCIFLPSTLNGVKSGCLLVFLLALGFYVTPAMLGGLRDVTLSMLIQTQVNQLADWGPASAASMLLLGATILGMLLVSKKSSGAVMLVIGGANTQSIGERKMNNEVDWPASSIAEQKGRGVAGAWDSLPEPSRLKSFLRNPPLFNGKVTAATFTVGLAGVALLFLLLPTLVVVPLSFGSADYLQFPPTALSLRWYQNFFSNRSWLEAATLSLWIATATVIIATAVGTLASLALAKMVGSARSLLYGLFVAPLVVPAIVIGVALFQPFAQINIIGSPAAIIAGHTIGAIPYVVIIVSALLETVSDNYERAAQSMGAGPWRVFVKVTLPLIAPGVVGGAVFAFIHSFDELVITMFVAGINSQTLPLKMWEDIRNQIDPTIAAVSSLLMLIPIVCLVIFQLIHQTPQLSHKQ